MKHLLPILVLVITLSSISQSLLAQDAQFNLDRKINLKNQDSVEKNIKINVSEGTINVYLGIECKVSMGNVTIEIFDPNGVKNGNFSIESQIEEELPIRAEYYNEIVEGQIEQRLESPIKGTWVIKITPEKATGNVHIKTKHYINY